MFEYSEDKKDLPDFGIKFISIDEAALYMAMCQFAMGENETEFELKTTS